MMRNLVRVLLVSSALVAVSAPSAYATPQEEASAATSSNFELLASLIEEPTLANLNAAIDECRPGDKICVINLLTAYAQLGVYPTQAQLDAIAARAGVTFTADDNVVIAAIGGAGGGAGGGTGPGAGGSGDSSGDAIPNPIPPSRS
jgi:hypothetical protein